MIIFSGLLTAFGRLIGEVATMTIGWATILLFGRIPQSKQTVLSFITLGSLAWVAALSGVLFPAVGGFLLAAIPRTSFIDQSGIRLVMLGLAALLPLAIGLATVAFIAPEARPTGRGRLIQLLRGYPFAAVYAITIVFLAAWGLAWKIRSLQHGWESAHVPMIVKPGRYDGVVASLESALRDAGLDVARTRASPWFDIPPRLLALVGGAAVRGLIPDELVEFRIADLAVLVYPSDVALLGREELVARARAAVARRLTFADAYLTTAKEAEQIEDRLAEIARKPGASAADFKPIDDLLTMLVAPYDEWETLYRLRLQVEVERRLPDAIGPASAS
ncbi:MAG: hypothetical protein ACYDAK_12440 [Candidatus Limnocylindrales bacterium]